MNQWMLETHGDPMGITEESRDRWYRDNGMIHEFLCATFPAENAIAQTQPDSGTKNL